VTLVSSFDYSFVKRDRIFFYWVQKTRVPCPLCARS